MYDAVGVYQTQADLQKYPVMQNTKVGDVRYRDANGDGVISDSDRTLMGKPDPDYTFGMTNTFKYKNFDLSILITGQTGGHIYGVLGRAMDRPGMGANINVLAHWKICGNRKQNLVTARLPVSTMPTPDNSTTAAGCTAPISSKSRILHWAIVFRSKRNLFRTHASICREKTC